MCKIIVTETRLGGVPGAGWFTWSIADGGDEVVDQVLCAHGGYFGSEQEARGHALDFVQRIVAALNAPHGMPFERVLQII